MTHNRNKTKNTNNCLS